MANDQDAEDSYRKALNAAWTPQSPADVEAAFSHLSQAATLGHRRAKAELAALGGRWRLAGEIIEGAESDEWKEVAGKIDPASWPTMQRPTVLSTGPHIAMADGFLSGDVCDWLIRAGRPHLQRATVYDSGTGKLREDAGRTNEAAIFDLAHIDMVVAMVRLRIAALSGLTLDGFEDTQVLHYSPGEEFGAHVDFLDPSEAGNAANVAAHGQRVLTALVYLNEDFEGGETTFVSINRAFKGKRGSALLFSNVTPEGEPDRRTVHIGSPPTKGEKWLLSQWIRFRPGA